MFVCYPPNLTTFGCYGGSWDQTRLPGSRQGTTVCVHTNMDVEQQSDHKLKAPSDDGVNWFVEQGRTLLSPWCARGGLPTGVNLVQDRVSLGTAITSPCSAHRIRLSS